jgi:Ca-activated chloride channel family protein
LKFSTMPQRAVFAALAGLAALALAAPLRAQGVEDERVRRFLEEGPSLLLPAAERAALAAADPAGRRDRVRAFLARDPAPDTPARDLAAAIDRRTRQLAAANLSPFDDRGRLMFLLGPPDERRKVECAETYRALELWRWGSDAAARWAVLYRPSGGRHHKLWRPTDSKRVLYTDEMEYLLEQIEELRGRVRGQRPDLAFCKDARDLDRITGVSGLFGFERKRMSDADVDALLAPPADLAAWVRGVLAAPPAEGEKPLAEPDVRVSFPARRDQRLVTRIRLDLPADAGLESVAASGGREVRVAVSGMIDRPQGVFEEFRNRFVFAPPAPGTPVTLLVERALRPGERFVARLEVRDETSGRVAWVERGFTVPDQPVPEPEPVPQGAVRGQDLGLARLGERDSLVLLPPVEDVVFGLFRAEAIVVGERIRKVVFLLDGKPQLSRSAPPWTAELRLPDIPKETVVRAEGYDADGARIAADEILLNEPQGEPRVRLLEPARGKRVAGTVHARAAVVVTEGRRIEKVEFKLNDDVVATLEQPPWEATIDVPSGGSLAYLTVTATYDDGTTVEDFRVLNSTDFVEQIEVELVELYATVTDRSGRLVDDLPESTFRLLDNGRPQKIARFEHVRDLPLTLGLLLDVSGSMRESLVEAKTAASDFLTRVMTPRDRCFAVGFAERPGLLMPLTSDARAIEVAFRDLPALGSTSLHDALVYALYQFKGVRGRKALVLLSDGDDTSSIVPWESALAYAERSGAAIYTIGLGIGKGTLSIRRKLESLAAETGGRTFFVDKAAELSGVYAEIDRELRSQYLLAFAPDPPAKEGERHTLTIQVEGGYKARAARGYTP